MSHYLKLSPKKRLALAHSIQHKDQTSNPSTVVHTTPQIEATLPVVIEPTTMPTNLLSELLIKSQRQTIHNYQLDNSQLRHQAAENKKVIDKLNSKIETLLALLKKTSESACSECSREHKVNMHSHSNPTSSNDRYTMLGKPQWTASTLPRH